MSNNWKIEKEIEHWTKRRNELRIMRKNLDGVSIETQKSVSTKIKIIDKLELEIQHHKSVIKDSNLLSKKISDLLGDRHE